MRFFKYPLFFILSIAFVVSYLNYKAKTNFSNLVFLLKQNGFSVTDIHYERGVLNSDAKFNLSYELNGEVLKANLKQKIYHAPFLASKSRNLERFSKNLLYIKTYLTFEDTGCHLSTTVNFKENVTILENKNIESKSIFFKNATLVIKGKKISFFAKQVNFKNHYLQFSDVSFKDNLNIGKLKFYNTTLNDMTYKDNSITAQKGYSHTLGYIEKMNLDLYSFNFKNNIFDLLTNNFYNLKIKLKDRQSITILANEESTKSSSFNFYYNLNLNKENLIKTLNICSPYLLRHLNNEKITSLYNEATNIFPEMTFDDALKLNLISHIKDNLYKLSIKTNKDYNFINNLTFSTAIKSVETFLKNKYSDNYTNIPNHKDLFEIIYNKDIPNSKMIDLYGIKTAVKFNNLSKLKIMLKDDINKVGIDNTTALYWATKFNKLEIVKYLLNQKANPNIKTYIGNWTPLHEACENNNVDIVDILIKNSASIKVKDKNNNTPIMLAIKNQSNDVINYFLKNNILNQSQIISLKNNESKDIING